MCGIAGCLTTRQDGDRIAGDVLAMTRALAHRGPDDEGILCWRRGGRGLFAATDHTTPERRDALAPAEAQRSQPWHLVLGHRRFSILDITAGGHQPFVDDQGRAAIVFNGEIYNFLELRAELQEAGVAFRTSSDTEVLLQACLHWREAALPRLNGMWAFAFVDLRSGRILLSRDRVGEKPLFFARAGDRFYFASEIKSLFQVPAIHGARKPDDLRVLDFLYLGLRDHRPGSFFHGIEQLPPASLAWLDENGTLDVRPYWQLPRQRWTARDLSFDEAAAGISGRLKASVALRLRADVPVAAELSGGMDSSSIVALASDHLRESGAPPLQTVTIRYPDREFDESPLAETVARACGVQWTPLTLEAQEYWDAADEMGLVQEQPYESPNLLGSRALWRWMKDRGIRVVLNGGAGDELLAGYIGHHLVPFFAELAASGRWMAAAREAAQWRGGRYLNRVALRRHLLHHLPGPAGRAYMKRMLGLPYFASLRRPQPALRGPLLNDARDANRFRLSEILLGNSEYAPLPMYMVHGDKLSMSIPIEVRFPFLDPELIEYAFRLPVDFLFRGGESKAVLRHAMRGRLPESITGRREKMGFPVPLARWMREGRGRIVRELQQEGRAARFVDIPKFCGSFDDVDPNLIWRIHQVETWMRLHDLR